MSESRSTLRNEDRSGVQVIDRAVALLRAMGESRRPAQLRDLSSHTGLSKSTVRRLLLAMEDNGLCEQTESGGYQLGVELFLLGQRVQGTLEVRDRARPYMEGLHERWGHTVFLCIRTGDNAVCVDRIEAEDVYSLAFRIGAVIPLHLAAAPRAILAWLPESEVRRYLATLDLLPRYTDHSITDKEVLLDYLRDSKEKGWVLSQEDVAEGIAAVAAPIFNHTGQVVAALSTSGTVQQIVHEELAPLVADVIDAAAAVSRAMGYRAPARPVRS